MSIGHGISFLRSRVGFVSLSDPRQRAAYHPLSILKQAWVNPNKRIFDNTKISDHFAIIPTLQTPRHLNEAEQKLYDLVVRRFLAVFFPAAEYLQTTRITRVGEHRFKTEGRVLHSPGWLAAKLTLTVRGSNRTVWAFVVPSESVAIRRSSR